MKHLLLAVLFAAYIPTASAQESAAQLPSPHSSSAQDEGGNEDAFQSAYELQLSYGRLAGISLGIPVGEHVHFEFGVGGSDEAQETNDYSFRIQRFGGNIRLRVDFASPAASFRPFLRFGGDLLRGRDYSGIWREWNVRATAGAQVRLHRHFGIEADAGVRYGRSSGDVRARDVGLHYSFGMVIYI